MLLQGGCGPLPLCWCVLVVLHFREMVNFSFASLVLRRPSAGETEVVKAFAGLCGAKGVAVSLLLLIVVQQSVVGHTIPLAVETLGFSSAAWAYGCLHVRLCLPADLSDLNAAWPLWRELQLSSGCTLWSRWLFCLLF